jgi:hypothetical protein
LLSTAPQIVDEYVKAGQKIPAIHKFHSLTLITRTKGAILNIYDQTSHPRYLSLGARMRHYLKAGGNVSIGAYDGKIFDVTATLVVSWPWCNRWVERGSGPDLDASFSTHGPLSRPWRQIA